MYTIHGGNVNYTLPMAFDLLKHHGRDIDPRGRPTLEIDEPVCTVYLSPRERVLFNPVRDANPFFHFFEALWMIAGRNDLAFVERFNKGMRAYSDDGTTLHSAYGWRWREQWGDQLAVIIQMLRREPNTRRAVLQIWGAYDDLGRDSKDLPCNTHVYFKIRENLLHMTVCNRSNDLIWGAYGANVVHFSMLQEYMAAQCGVGVGLYHQMSDSLHVYTDKDDFGKLVEYYMLHPEVEDPYTQGLVEPYSMVLRPDLFDEELRRFLADPDSDLNPMFPEEGHYYTNPFFPHVAYPMWLAWRAHKETKNGWKELTFCQATDWRKSGMEWLHRRADGPEFEERGRQDQSRSAVD